MRLTLAERKEIFLEIYKRKGCNVSTACVAADIARKTFYNWIKEKNFGQAVKDAEEQLHDMVESHLVSHIQGGNAKVAMFFAKTKMKHRGYTHKQEVEHSGISTIEVTFALPDEKKIIDVTPHGKNTKDKVTADGKAKPSLEAPD